MFHVKHRPSPHRRTPWKQDAPGKSRRPGRRSPPSRSFAVKFQQHAASPPASVDSLSVKKGRAGGVRCEGPAAKGGEVRENLIPSCPTPGSPPSPPQGGGNGNARRFPLKTDGRLYFFKAPPGKGCAFLCLDRESGNPAFAPRQPDGGDGRRALGNAHEIFDVLFGLGFFGARLDTGTAHGVHRVIDRVEKQPHIPH